MRDLPAGAIFAEHRILAVAGRGGMGVVYRALHLPLKREVALKVIAPDLSADDEFRARFRRECEAAASIHHPHVVPVYHAGEEGDLLYVTMRFVEGTDLAQMIETGAPLSPKRAVALIAQVADGLEAAHQRGLVHRDVKPANVLIAEGTALLTDFGVTKDLRRHTQHTDHGHFVGTFDYAAPEQFKSEPADARTDVYALGCVLFEALTGSVPFPAESDAAKMFAHVEAPRPSVGEYVPSVPEPLVAVVRRAMATERRDRFASAAEFGQAALGAVGPDTAITPLPPVPAPLAPPPALLLESGHGPFVGRADELKRLRRRLSGALRGERQFVVVTGEPGIGTSRLVIEFARAAHAGGASVLAGRSDAESLVPYQPFLTALGHAGDWTFPPELEPEIAELGRFIPSLRRHARVPVADDPETRRYRLFEAITRLLAFAAREHPVVLILDDLQWADPSTAQLLAHVLGDPEPVRLLVLATLREQGEEHPEALAALLARQRRLPSFERIALTGLDGDETDALVRAHAPEKASASFVARLREETAGNPFLLEELLRAGELGVPAGVEEMIARRLAGLDEMANQVLTVASVAGREFGLDALEGLIDADADAIISVLERATELGLVREVEGEVDRFRFAHALVREALYERQSTSRRVRLHHQIAETLEAAQASPAEIAYHYRESRHLDEAGKASAFAERAGHAAAAALAYEEAVEHFHAALAGAGPERAGELWLALGEVQSRAGDEGARATFARAAELARDGEALARAALGFAGATGGSGLVDREAIALLERALAALGDDESALAVEVRARLADGLHFAGVPERTLALSAAALTLARRLGDTEALVAALEARHGAMLHAGYLPQRLLLGQELLDVAQRIGDRELEALGHHVRVRDLAELPDFAEARLHHRALKQLAGELRQPLYQHFAVSWDALFALCAGRNADAERFALEAFELGRRAGVRPAGFIFAAQTLTRRFRMGVTPELVGRLEELTAQGPGLPMWRALLALAYLRVGRRESARAGFEELTLDRVPLDMLWLATVCTIAEVCAELGDEARGRELYDALWPYRERQVQAGTGSCAGSLERYLGLLSGSVEHFEVALARNLEWEMRHMLPLSLTELADALLARRGPGDAARAHELLQKALPEAEALGMAPLAAKVRASLLDPIEHA